MSQLEKLKAIAAQESLLIKHELEIKGQDLTFWSKPLTIAEYNQAKKESKNKDDILETTARLFVKKAVDANGQRQYAIDALPVLLSLLSVQTATKILKAMDEEVEQEVTDLDLKSTGKGSEKRQSSKD